MNLPADAAGLSGLGYSVTDHPENAYIARALSAPLSVRQRISWSASDLNQQRLPLVSRLKGMHKVSSWKISADILYT